MQFKLETHNIHKPGQNKLVIYVLKILLTN